MNIWFFVWLIATLVLVYFVGWTLIIIFRQRKTWHAFAKKYDLRYETPTLTSSPKMEGIYNDYAISLFTSEHASNTRRGSRRLTAVECLLKSPPIIQGGVANGDMRDFLQNTLGYNNEIPIKHEKWTSQFIAASPQSDQMKMYLTDERIKGITALGAIKNAWIILIMHDDTVLLRVDLPDALASEKKLNVLVNKIVKVAQSLEPTKDEIETLSIAETLQPQISPDPNQTDT